ncbi:MAG: hypothetical protein M1817_000359 [Caeruleum heppii]|nr:MAG: hypothetical protein M1817_000359 [Caeruleum heppii]
MPAANFFRREAQASDRPEGAPTARKPKSRPPENWRDRLHLVPGRLPRSSGPYSVGTIDLEIPVDEPRNLSPITRHQEHVLRLETVLLSIYYPAAVASGTGHDPADNEKWSRPTWLPRPRAEVAKGYATFAEAPRWSMMLWFLSTTWFTKVPAFRNAHLASHWPPEENARQAGFEVKNEEGRPPPMTSGPPRFALVMFSHGLGGNRTMYSSMCSEFASYGFVVCALEHRDGSGARTFVNHPPANPASGARFGNADQEQEDGYQSYHRVDYLFPKDNPHDTSPVNEKGIDEDLRAAQIELRLAEIEEAYNIMAVICDGNGHVIARKNLRRKGAMGASSRGLDGVDWDGWRGRVHLQQVTMVGHSFGAATAVEVLRNEQRFNWVSAGIIYDIWGVVVKPPDNTPGHRISAPLLGINSEAFMYWPENFESVMRLCQETTSQGFPCWLMTVRGSIHMSQSDMSLLYPTFCSLMYKMTVNPRRAIDININASLEFLKIVMPREISAINRGDDEGLLQVEPLDELPTEHKPDPKHTGTKLKIPHEFSSRVAPKLTRKAKRKKAPGVKDEIWMHVAPAQEAVSGYTFKSTSTVGNQSSLGTPEYSGTTASPG